MIQAVYQNPRNLTLGIISGSHNIPLSVLKHEICAIGEWHVKFCIIGESHSITILRDNVPVLSEVLACVDISPQLCSHHHRFDNLLAHCFAQPGYNLSVSFEQCGQDDDADYFSTLGDSIRTFDGSIEMKFPQTYGHTPITRIEWTKLSDSQIEWRTWHIYPEDNDVWCVCSLSVFDTLNYNNNP